MTRSRTLYLPALLGTLVAAVLVTCAVALLAVSGEAEATFPGKNGRIAYSAWDVGTDGAIYTITPGGGGKTKVTRGYQPSYSPDGKRIAYTAFSGTDTEIYTINVGGGGNTRVTNDNKDESDPSYSPDGKKIAYSRTTYRGRALPIDEIYTVKVGGGRKTKVTNGRHPVYSPDGKRIVFYARDKSSPIRDTEIYTIKVDGSGKTQLTNNNKDEFTPDYSPDGKRIVYAGLAGLERNNAESDIYTINVGGGAKFRVTHGKGDEGGPAWGRRP